MIHTTKYNIMKSLSITVSQKSVTAGHKEDSRLQSAIITTVNISKYIRSGSSEVTADFHEKFYRQ